MQMHCFMDGICCGVNGGGFKDETCLDRSNVLARRAEFSSLRTLTRC